MILKMGKIHGWVMLDDIERVEYGQCAEGAVRMKRDGGFERKTPKGAYEDLYPALVADDLSVKHLYKGYRKILEESGYLNLAWAICIFRRANLLSYRPSTSLKNIKHEFHLLKTVRNVISSL